MLNFRFRGRSSDLPQPVSKPATNEDFGGRFERVLKGDVPGHPFRGNQYTDVAGGGDEGSASGGGRVSAPPAPVPDAKAVEDRMNSDNVGGAGGFARVLRNEHGVERHKDAVNEMEGKILSNVLDKKPGLRDLYEKHKADLKTRQGDEVKGADGKFAGFKGETRYANSAIPGRDATEKGVGFEPTRAALNEEYAQNKIKEAREAARPVDGEDPTFMNLAGRGGSGKGKVEINPKYPERGGLYDPAKNVVVNADPIKMDLLKRDGLEGQGHLAPLYHEESSQIAERIMELARAEKLNVVYDATMKSDKPQIPEDFEKSGYKNHTVMVLVGDEEAAGRSVERYVRGTNRPGDPDNNPKTKPGEVGRLVPPAIVLGNVRNEDNFDNEVARRIGNHPGNKFTLYDNRGGDENTPLRLIANEKGEGLIGKAAVAAALRRKQSVLEKKLDSSDNSGIIREKGVVDMVSKLDRTGEQRWEDAQDYPDMPDGNLDEEEIFKMFRNMKKTPESLNKATGGRRMGLEDRYAEWLKDHPFNS